MGIEMAGVGRPRGDEQQQAQLHEFFQCMFDARFALDGGKCHFSAHPKFAERRRFVRCIRKDAEQPFNECAAQLDLDRHGCDKRHGPITWLPKTGTDDRIAVFRYLMMGSIQDDTQSITQRRIAKKNRAILLEDIRLGPNQRSFVPGCTDEPQEELCRIIT